MKTAEKVEKMERILKKARKIKKISLNGGSLSGEDLEIIRQAEAVLIKKKITELKDEIRRLKEAINERKIDLIEKAWGGECSCCQKKITGASFIFPAVFLLGWAVEKGRQIPAVSDFLLKFSYLEPEDLSSRFICAECRPRAEKWLKSQSPAGDHESNRRLHHPAWLLNEWALKRAEREARKKEQEAEAIRKQIESLKERIEK